MSLSVGYMQLHMYRDVQLATNIAQKLIQATLMERIKRWRPINLAQQIDHLLESFIYVVLYDDHHTMSRTTNYLFN